MISEGSCDKYDAKNSSLHHRNELHFNVDCNLKNHLNCNNILQNCLKKNFLQINSALVSMSFKNVKKNRINPNILNLNGTL